MYFTDVIAKPAGQELWNAGKTLLFGAKLPAAERPQLTFRVDVTRREGNGLFEGSNWHFDLVLRNVGSAVVRSLAICLPTASHTLFSEHPPLVVERELRCKPVASLVPGDEERVSVTSTVFRAGERRVGTDEMFQVLLQSIAAGGTHWIVLRFEDLDGQRWAQRCRFVCMECVPEAAVSRRPPALGKRILRALRRWFT